MIGLGDLPGGDFFSIATGVTGDGKIVTGGSTSLSSPIWSEAFLWTPSTGLSGLGVLPAINSPATVPGGISEDGSVVAGWAFTLNGREAFRWTESTGFVPMGDLPGGLFDSVATGVSVDGSTIVGIGAGPGTTAFRWTQATGMMSLGVPTGGNQSEALAVSGDGAVVVGDAGVAGARVPAIWDEVHGMRNLEDVLIDLGLSAATAGWNLEQATGVSADGKTIVGWGYNPRMEREAWIAHLGNENVVEVSAASAPVLALFALLLAAAAIVMMKMR